MKKNILYLLAFVTVIFAACNPLKDEIGNITPAPFTKTLNITLAKADYELLPSTNYANKGQYFANTVDANTSISVILNAKYPQLDNGSVANVSYNSLPQQIKPADSVLSTAGAAPTQYSVVDADYLAINGNSNKNFTTAKVIQFLDTKFPTKVANQLIVLNYVYFESGATTTTGVATSDTFIYLNGAWVKAYQVTQAQYISAGKLTVFNFGSADEANLAGYFNTFLKSDANVSGKAKIGDVKYVSFAYFISSTRTAQRIKALIFDGTNWSTKSVPFGPLPFLKKKGTWIPDPTVYYTLIKSDYTVLKSTDAAAVKPEIGTAAGRLNAGDFGSFDVTGGGNSWTDAQIGDAVAYILNGKYASAPVDETVLYKITYALFKGATPTAVKSFAKTSTGFKFVPDEN